MLHKSDDDTTIWVNELIRATPDANCLMIDNELIEITPELIEKIREAAKDLPVKDKHDANG